MTRDLLKCCGVELVLQNIEHHNFIECFKSSKFFRKKMTDGREIKKEIVLVTFCPQCKHYILKYLWYAKRTTDFWEFDEQHDIRGKKADEIFNRRSVDYMSSTIPNPYSDYNFTKQSKKIPWVYYKSVDKGMSQQPMYLDDTAKAGRKIYSPPKITKI